MKYILNSAVITRPGTYTYKLITKLAVADWVQSGDWESKIGYPVTAKHIESISGVLPDINREATEMCPGDEALVVRLKYRVQDPANKKDHKPQVDDWEYGILTCVTKYI